MIRTNSGNGRSPGSLCRVQKNSHEKMKPNRSSAAWMGISGEAAQVYLAQPRSAVHSVSVVEREATAPSWENRDEISEQSTRVDGQPHSSELFVGRVWVAEEDLMLPSTTRTGISG